MAKPEFKINLFNHIEDETMELIHEIAKRTNTSPETIMNQAYDWQLIDMIEYFFACEYDWESLLEDLK